MITLPSGHLSYIRKMCFAHNTRPGYVPMCHLDSETMLTEKFWNTKCYMEPRYTQIARYTKDTLYILDIPWIFLIYPGYTRYTIYTRYTLDILDILDILDMP